jgi:hypothetical protein
VNRVALLLSVQGCQVANFLGLSLLCLGITTLFAVMDGTHAPSGNRRVLHSHSQGAHS